MNILIDAHLTEFYPSGIARYLDRLITNLALIDSQHEFYILVGMRYSMNISGDPENIHFITTSLKGISFSQHFRIRSFTRSLNASMYHHPHFDLPISCDIPSIITIHDLKYLRNPEFFPDMSLAKLFYMKYMMRSAISRADRIIAVSHFTKNDILGMFDVDESKITVIYEGVDIDTPQTTDTVMEHHIMELTSTPYFLTVAERRPHKNLPWLIESFARFIKKSRANYRLLIVGRPYSGYNEPEKTISRFGLSNEVLLLGNLDEAIVRELYKHTSLFVFPSLYEGFGLPILEAMSTGALVAGSNRTAVPEIIGEAGLLFDPVDSEEIIAIFRRVEEGSIDTDHYKTLGKQRALEFQWEKTARETLQIYESLR